MRGFCENLAASSTRAHVVRRGSGHRPFFLVIIIICAIGLAAFATSGCVERRLIVRSDPPGARVEVDGVDHGVTPATILFYHYGTRRIVLRQDDHETRTALVQMNPPIWQLFPLDLVTDVLLPFTIVDEHALDPFHLAPRGTTAAPSEEEDRALVERGARAIEQVGNANPEEPPR